MYYCENCYNYFENSKLIEDSCGLPGPWRRRFDGCPRCGVVGMIGEKDDEAI